MADESIQFEDVLDALKLRILREARTAVPGIVEDFSALRNTATIRIAQKLQTSNGQTEELAPIPNVPVAWPSFGPHAIYGSLQPGDPVILLVADRPLDDFRASGQAHDPGEDDRTHDLADAIALPLGITQAKAGEMSAGAYLRIGRRDGLAEIKISNTGADVVINAAAEVRIGDAATEWAARADLVLSQLQSIASTFNGHTHVAPSGGGTTTTPSGAMSPGAVESTKLRIE